MCVCVGVCVCVCVCVCGERESGDVGSKSALQTDWVYALLTGVSALRFELESIILISSCP